MRAKAPRAYIPSLSKVKIPVADLATGRGGIVILLGREKNIFVKLAGL
jgi:hypothetical protein